MHFYLRKNISFMQFYAINLFIIFLYLQSCFKKISSINSFHFIIYFVFVFVGVVVITKSKLGLISLDARTSGTRIGKIVLGASSTLR